MDINEKLNTFSKIVFHDAFAKREELDQERTRILEEAKSKYELEILEEAYNMIQTEINRENARRSEIISSETIKAKKELFECREKAVARIFERVREKLCEFVKTPEYKDWLIAMRDDGLKFAKGGNAVVYICKNDEGFASLLKQDNVEVVVVDEPFIGGCKVWCKDERIIVDNTLATKLEEEQGNFHEIRID